MTSNRVPIYISVGILVIAIAIGSVYVLGIFLPSQDAAAQYATAHTDLVKTQSALTEQVQAGTEITSTVTSAQLADPALMDSLTQRLANAQGLLAPPPTMAAETQAILDQVAYMRTQATAAKDAKQAIADLLTSVTASRVTFAKKTLSEAISQAGELYHSSEGNVSKNANREALKNATAKAKAALAASQPPTPQAALTAYTTAAQELQDAIRVVQDDVTSVASANYTYLLTGGSVRSGDNFGAAVISAAKVSVQGAQVTVEVCSSAEKITKVDTCETKAGAVPWWTFTGTRNGKVAIVAATTNNPDGFFWATVTFDSDAPQAKATRFVGANGCSRPDGTSGKLKTSAGASHCE